MPFFLASRFPKLAATAVVIIPVAFAAYFQVNSMKVMKQSLALREKNAALVGNLKGTPVAVFVGGTAGIGQGLAEAFARWRNGNAHIVIVGRNEAAAKEIIERFPKPTTTSSWTHEFVQCDVTLMKNVQSASEQILAKHPKINYLVMSPGFFAASGRDETSEGIDKKLAAHYYARWKFIDELLPALKKAKDDGEDVRVLSVFSAGEGGNSKMDPNDLGLKKRYSLKAAADSATTYNDLMIEVRFPRPC
jgi:NAD(P)-dependent dehydrogenase (short-subunit alcohol dehydrogenase family)